MSEYVRAALLAFAAGVIFGSWIYVWVHKLVAPIDGHMYVIAGVGLGLIIRHFWPYTPKQPASES